LWCGFAAPIAARVTSRRCATCVAFRGFAEHADAASRSNTRVQQSVSIEQVLHAGLPDFPIDRQTLACLLRTRPPAGDIIGLVSSPELPVARAAVVYFAVCGTMQDCPLLALHLHHADDGVAAFAEYSLWSIWMQAGSPTGNRRLADAIGCIKRRSYARAVELLDELNYDEPGFAEAHFQKGIALAFLDRLEEAAAAYREALRLNPYHFAAAEALGHIAVEQGQLAAALEHYRRALRIHPRLTALAHAVRALERVVQPDQTRL